MEPPPRPVDGGFATRSVHAGSVPDVAQRPMSPPIHPSATWAVERSRDLADLLADRLDGYVYGRYDNPTNTALHAQVATLHGAESSWSFASGTAAVAATLEVLRADGRILAARGLYGGTFSLLRRVGQRAGWQVDLVDVVDIPSALTDRHTVVYVETIANPTMAVADLEALGRICRERGVPLVVDNTFASPYLCRPIELGATAVVESATKFLGGHSDVVGGVVAASRTLVTEIRQWTYEVGSFLGPFEAWLVSRGVQTLELRLTRSSSSALALAEQLASDARVAHVAYPGLDTHPTHDIARRLFAGRGFGAMLAFDLGDRAAAERFCDACRLIARAASLGGTHTLVIHPASTTHRQLDEPELREAGIGPGLIRMSVGIEDLEDLSADVADALKEAVG